MDVTEFVDNRLMMSCSARGDPPPTVQWQKRNGTGGRWTQVSRASERYKVQRSGNLVIRRLLASDAGLFRCVAENAVGSAYSAAATLVVQGERAPLRQSNRSGVCVSPSSSFRTVLGTSPRDPTESSADATYAPSPLILLPAVK